MLVIPNEDIEKIISMPDCIRALEEVYADLAEDRALVSPRVDSLSPNGREDAHYAFKTMGGAWPRRGVQALRIGSDVIAYRRVGEQIRQDKLPLAGGRYVGLVELFDTGTGELLAMFPDGIVQTYRVGATNGIAAKYLARADASTVGLIGAGFQARTQLLAVAAVRDIRRVRVYSLREESRRAFAAAMSRELGVEVTAVDSPERAAEGADILMSATSAVTPVMRPEWVRPGLHVSCVKKQEATPELMRRCDRVVVHNKKQVKQQDYVMPGTPNVAGEQLGGWWTSAEMRWDRQTDLPELVTRPELRRRSEEEATLFVNNLGLGLQFAAVGAVILEKARERGLGHELPAEWFTQTIRS